MITITDRFYAEAAAIHGGTYKLAETYQEITNWISKEFHVTALDFMFEKRETNGKSQQLVHVIVNSNDEARKLDSTPSIRQGIHNKFAGYFSSMPTIVTPDPIRTAVFSSDTKPFPEIFVTFRALESVKSIPIEGVMTTEWHELLQTYPDVWTMSQRVVFYYTDAQIRENKQNGTSDNIVAELKKIMAKHDRSDFYGGNVEFRFDSKEYFDGDCKGAWHNYWK